MLTASTARQKSLATLTRPSLATRRGPSMPSDERRPSCQATARRQRRGRTPRPRSSPRSSTSTAVRLLGPTRTYSDLLDHPRARPLNGSTPRHGSKTPPPRRRHGRGETGRQRSRQATRATDGRRAARQARQARQRPDGSRQATDPASPPGRRPRARPLSAWPRSCPPRGPRRLGRPHGSRERRRRRTPWRGLGIVMARPPWQPMPRSVHSGARARPEARQRQRPDSARLG